MTRMIERWFPSTEVSANSQSGWGSGNSEVGIMSWFAKRPTAQAKAATICSLLPWPEGPSEQQRLQQLADTLSQAQETQKQLETRGTLLHRIDVYRHFQELDWHTPTLLIQRLEEERQSLESTSDTLRLLQQQLGEIRPVLSRNACNQGCF